MISIDFELHKVELDIDKLYKFRSKHFDDNERWRELESQNATKDNLVLSNTKTFNQQAIYVANNCFAEAAFSNPIDDLKLYQTWKTGMRSFPFSGTYTRIGLLNQQKSKKVSESVMGALGEIIGGLLFNTQATIHLRSIQKYPDFMGKLKKQNGWAFLEAKCYENVQNPIFNKRVPRKEYKELCLKAAEEFKDDKSLLFYASFTKIENYSPLKVKQTLIEISDVNRNSALQKKIKTPLPFTKQTIEGCVNESLYDLGKEIERKSFTEIRDMHEESIKKELEERTWTHIDEIEKRNNLKGAISSDEDTRKIIDDQLKDSESKIKDLLNKKLEMMIFPKIEKYKMNKGDEINDKQAIYIQILDESQVKTINTTRNVDWDIESLQRKDDEIFFLIGNSYVGIANTNITPKIIDKFDEEDWKIN